jgi:hypothetical protein
MQGDTDYKPLPKEQREIAERIRRTDAANLRNNRNEPGHADPRPRNFADTKKEG